MEEIKSQEDEIQEGQERKWCVYIHRNMINNKAYIGITSRNPEDRWGHNGNQYKEDQLVFCRAIKKYKWHNFEHIIFMEHLSEIDAKHIEKLLIALFKTNVCRWGDDAMGYNMTDGGDGKSGGETTDETREKIRQSQLLRWTDEAREMQRIKFSGENNPMYGKEVSSETRKKISKGNQGKHSGENHYLYGKTAPLEHRNRIGEALKTRWMEELNPWCNRDFTNEKNPRARKVIRLSDLTIYNYLGEAAEANGCHRDTMWKRCKDKKGFMYYDEYLIEQNNLKGDNLK